MILSEYWKEIVYSIKRNKVRTLLSGFTISSGISIFIILFGLGNGLNNGFENKFKSKLNNYITIKFNRLKSPIVGKSDSTNSIKFNKKNYNDLIKKNKSLINKNSTIKSKEVLIKYRTESSIFEIIGVNYSYKEIKGINIIKGNFISKLDSNQNNIVIGKHIEKQLFKNKSSLGEKIIINNLFFKVVGVFKNDLNEIEEQKIYLSENKYNSLFKLDENIESFIITNNKDLSLNEVFNLKDNLKKQIQESLKISQYNASAINIKSGIEEGKDANNFLIVINLVVIFIGIGTLISGSIGISNIMLYSIKERFFEIGIRKAVGAKSINIVLSIVGETIFTMIFFGFIGIMFGTLVLRSIGNNLEDYFILNPYVKYNQIIFAFIIIFVLGLIASIFPAKYATKLKPSECINKNQF